MLKIFRCLALLILSQFCSGTLLAKPILTPSPGQALIATKFGDGAIITLEMDRNGDDIQEWAFYIGTSQGAWDIHRITHMNRYQYVVEPEPQIEKLPIGIPADGSTFWIRFWWLDRNANDFQYEDYSFVAPNFE